MDKEERKSYGPLIREARLAQGLDQQDLADLAEISRRTLGNIERGDTSPQREVLERLLTSLGLIEPRLDSDVEAFLAMLGPVLQRMDREERTEVMPQLVRWVMGTRAVPPPRKNLPKSG